MVVVSSREFERLRRGDRSAVPGLVEHLIAVPKPGPAKKAGGRPKRPALRLREVDLS